MEALRGAGDYPAEQPQQQDSSIQEYLTVLMRGKWLILATFTIVTLAVAFVTFTSEPVYESTAMVLIDMKSTQGELPIYDLLGTAVTNKLTNELETLKSRSMAQAVAKRLLERKFRDAAQTQLLAVIQQEQHSGRQPVFAEEASIAKRLSDNVLFAPIRDSDIIKITARSHNPAEAALIANTYADAYLDRNLSTSRLRSRAVREFLQSQLESKHRALDTTETELQSYMRTSGMVDMDTDTKQMVEQLAKLEATRDAIVVDIKTQRTTLDSYKQQLERVEPNVGKAIGESNDTYIRLLQEQLAQIEVQRDVLISQNPALVGKDVYSSKLQEIDAQIRSLKKNLEGRTTAFLNQVAPGTVGTTTEPGAGALLTGLKQKIIEGQIALDGLHARESALNAALAVYEAKFNRIPEKVIELAKRQRARLSTEKLYLLVEEKFNEAAITETSELGYVNILDPAVPPADYVSPRKVLNTGLGMLAGLFLGIAVVMVRAYLDDRVRTPEDLKRRGYIPLSAINRMQWNKQWNIKKNGDGRLHMKRNGNGTSQVDGKNFDVHLVAHFNPFSPLAEAYRHLRTNVMYTDADRPMKSLLFTSAGLGEGKSTTIANLAITIAQTEQKVLLVDADMRRASVHVKFGLPGKPGLTDVLFERIAFEEAVHAGVVPNLDILTSGTTPPNPAEILGSRKLREFIEFATGQYDMVLFDSPPLLAVTDASVLARAVDGAVMVCSAGDTRIGALDRASEFLASVGRKALGVVLNNFDVQKAYGGYYGYHRYGHYGYGYGYYQKAMKEG